MAADALEKSALEAKDKEQLTAIAEALGMTLEVRSQDPQTLRQQEARRKAEAITRMAQATSALEGQAVSDTVFEQLVQRATAQLLSGSRRRLWFR